VVGSQRQHKAHPSTTQIATGGTLGKALRPLTPAKSMQGLDVSCTRNSDLQEKRQAETTKNTKTRHRARTERKKDRNAQTTNGRLGEKHKPCASDEQKIQKTRNRATFKALAVVSCTRNPNISKARRRRRGTGKGPKGEEKEAGGGCLDPKFDHFRWGNRKRTNLEQQTRGRARRTVKNTCILVGCLYTCRVSVYS